MIQVNQYNIKAINNPKYEIILKSDNLYDYEIILPYQDFEVKISDGNIIELFVWDFEPLFIGKYITEYLKITSIRYDIERNKWYLTLDE